MSPLPLLAAGGTELHREPGNDARSRYSVSTASSHVLIVAAMVFIVIVMGFHDGLNYVFKYSGER